MSTIQLKSDREIGQMRKAGAIVYEVLQRLGEMVAPGITTKDLDREARRLTESAGAVPAFLNYPSSNSAVKPFPGVICSSKNEVIVHGIPDNVPLKEGDILSIDFGCAFGGYFADSAITVPIGMISQTAQKLLKTTRDSLSKAIEECVAGKRIGDLSSAVQRRVERDGFAIVREFVGHGIGTKMHEPPAVPNFGQPKQGRVLRPGMVLAIEPMVTVGSPETIVLDDGWSAITKDHSLAAHFEHTVAITNDRAIILTLP